MEAPTLEQEHHTETQHAKQNKSERLTRLITLIDHFFGLPAFKKHACIKGCETAYCYQKNCLRFMFKSLYFTDKHLGFNLCSEHDHLPGMKSADEPYYCLFVTVSVCRRVLPQPGCSALFKHVLYEHWQ